MTVTPSDLATYLGIAEGDINTDRAQMLIDDAVADALSVVVVGVVPDDGPTVDNLPPGSDSVIRAAAGRIYTNPTGATSETVGPFAVGRPAPSGATLSGNERRKLRRLAGMTGAFSIDTTPDCAGFFLDPLRDDIEVSEDLDLDIGL